MASLRASGALGLVANDGQSSADVEGGTVASDLESPSPSSDLLPESAAAAHKVYDRRQTIDWAHGTAGNGLEEHLDHVDAQLAAESSASAAAASTTSETSKAEDKEVHSEPYISPKSHSSKQKKGSSKCDVTLYTTLSTSVFDTRNYTVSFKSNINLLSKISYLLFCTTKQLRTSPDAF